VVSGYVSTEGRPGLSVVCLHRVNGQLHLDPDETSAVCNPRDEPDKGLIRELARRSMTIRRPDIEKQLLTEPSDVQIKTILAHWRRIAALRYHRVVILEENGMCRLNGTPYVLKLNMESQLGLQICKEAQ
jgi:hypothetical protein